MTLIRRIDAAIQKRFDASVHAFMRATGATKRSIRRNGWGVALFACSGIALFGTSPPGWGDAVMMCVYGFTLWSDDRWDEEAEKAHKMRSIADSGETYRKMVGVGLFVFDALLLIKGWRWQCAFSCFLQLVWAFQGYLCATNPEAPQKQREETPVARMAEVSP